MGGHSFFCATLNVLIVAPELCMTYVGIVFHTIEKEGETVCFSHLMVKSICIATSHTYIV